MKTAIHNRWLSASDGMSAVKGVSRRLADVFDVPATANQYDNPSLIDPRRSRWMPAWDITLLCSLIYTASITPYEVAFIDAGPCITPIFVLNRFVDLIFTIDIFVIFNTIYEDVEKDRWVYSRPRIALRYIKGFFVIDVISVAPLYIINFVAPPPGFVGCGAHGQILDDTASTNHSARSMLSIVKLLRLLKLGRMFKGTLLPTLDPVVPWGTCARAA